MIHSMDDLAQAIQYYGILPFFTNRVSGWSVEEMCDPDVYFTDQPGPWEWKGPLASEKICVYGKFIQNKAAFISPEWFPDLANYRRDGYAWDERVEDGLVPYKDRLLMTYLESHPYVLSKYAKRECGFSKGYDTVLTRLQMQTYIVTSDFQYSVSRAGVPYGWGNAVIEIADRWLGEDFWSIQNERGPEESFERMIVHLKQAVPNADEALLRKELK
ncbi:MAG: hypothetical protein IKE25_10815 [Clostridia bacterium]|nr:hypothetical protein [Clostridia bacterium]